MTTTAPLKKRILALLLALFMTVSVAFVTSTTAEAAGPGYSDIFRVYGIVESEGGREILTLVYLYGSANNLPQDNYALVLGVDVNYYNLECDVIDGKQAQELIDSAISVSYIDINNFTDYISDLGWNDDDLLFIEDKPQLVTALQKTFEQNLSRMTIKDNVIVYPDALKWAAANSQDSFYINFDSMDGGSVDVRITVYPSAATKGFSTIAATDTDGVQKTIELFEKSYSNKFAGLEFLQSGSFGTNVQVSAKLDLSGMDTNNLAFYNYNPRTNSYARIQSPNYSVDSNGYLRFETDRGGILLVTNGPLVKK